MKGRDALKIVWDEGDGVTETTATLRQRFADQDATTGRVVRRAGDPEAMLEEVSNRIDVTYEMPFLAHLAMEPINCVAHVEGGTCRVFGPIQLPEKARDRKSTRLNSSHTVISYAVFCLKKKKK